MKFATLLQERTERTGLKKVLLIDDDTGLCENLSDILTLSGYEASTAFGGLPGVERAIKDTPDLIVCDIVMPDLDGHAVFNILNLHPATHHVPFIFLSGQLKEYSDLRKGMNLGVDDYLIKPLVMADFLEAVETRLKKTENNKLKSNLSQPYTKARSDIDFSDLITVKEITRKFKRKHLLYSYGQKITHVHFLVVGKAIGYLTNEDGKEFITNLYTAGDFFGYTLLSDNEGHCESVRLQEDCELLLIPKADFEFILKEKPEATRTFLKKLAGQVTEKEQRLLNLAYNSNRKKVASGILCVIDKFREEEMGKPVIRMSRDDLARIIGAATESIIRVLKQFETEETIEINDGDIYILDEYRLRHLAN